MPLFGWGKRREEVREIKEAVAGPAAPYPEYPALPMPPMPMARPFPTQPAPPKYPSPPSYPAPPVTPVAPGKFAPLFVKVEKYKDILETVAKLKGTLANIESILKARAAIMELRSGADELLQRQLAVCAECAAALDSVIVRPPALESMAVAQPEVIEGEMTQISSRLSALSEQLREIG